MRLLPLLISLAASGQVLANDWIDLNYIGTDVEYPQWLDSAHTNTGLMSREVSDLYVDLSKWVEEQHLYSNQATRLLVFADTVEIPENFNLVVNNQNIVIFARRIVGQGVPTFVLGQKGAASSVTVISQSIETPINVLSYQADGSVKHDAITSSSAKLGQSVLVAGKYYRASDIKDDVTSYMHLAKGSFADVLNRSFDMAGAIFDQNRTTSLAMLNWIEKGMRNASSVVENDPLLSDLYLQTIAFKQFARFNAGATHYVPYLDRVLYKDKYQAYLTAMIEYQAQYDIAVNRKSNEQDKVDSASLAAEKVSDVLTAQDAIIKQTQANISKIQDRLIAVEAQYKTQELKVLTARTNYLYGVELWKTQQELNAAFQIFKAIADIGSAVSGVFTGNMSGISDVTEQLAKAPEAVEKTKNMITNIKSLTSVIDSITKTVAGISQLTTDVKGAIKQQKIAAAVDGFNFSVPTIEESNLAWDSMLIDVRSNLRMAQGLGIKGTRVYLLELEKQILLGKGINTTQLTLVQEQAKLVDLTLTKEVSTKQKARLESAITRYETEGQGYELIERELARALNHFKRPMFVALSNYVQAFNYWSLDESSIKPSLNMSYLDYQLALASIENEYLAALSSFQPAPQDFTIDDYVLNDRAQLDEFVHSGSLSFDIPINQTKFCAFDRVRLNTVRVFLEGEDLPYGKQFNVTLSNTGNYKDRLKQDTFEFNANPLSRAFYYRLDDARENQVSIITDGAVARKFEYAYFQPTPFTTWNVKLHNFDQQNPENNRYLEDLEQIRVEFLGSGIPNGAPCH